MNKEILIKVAEEFVNSSRENYISEDIAISEELIGMRIFDSPIFGFASSDDKYFSRLKDPSIIGEHFLGPNEWLPEAKTVISFFLPFSYEVRSGNSRDMRLPSDEWLHGRIEGQAFLNKLSLHLQSHLIDMGYKSLVPSLDVRSTSYKGKYTSNWSERHIAFISGLGTFGLSKGLITSKGMAGRFGSIITELSLAPLERNYEDVYEYCSMCGDCVINCPVNAISLEDGKDHDICSKFLDHVGQKFKPRYGCGKCQVNVACEYEIPK